jgi:hypothetical protein
MPGSARHGHCRLCATQPVVSVAKPRFLRNVLRALPVAAFGSSRSGFYARAVGIGPSSCSLRIALLVATTLPKNETEQRVGWLGK